MERFMKHISTIFRCAVCYRSKRLENIGINGCQTSYVMHICKNPGITQEQLTQQIHVNRSSVTRQLAFLEENGFITRKRCETDRRTIEVYPTEKMTAAFPIVQQVLKDWKNALTEGLSPQEKEQIEVLTEHLARRAKELV